ncbi:MAG: hypothetical protein RL748_1689 [Pseudomonadota bacterium]|jgi:peptidyl-Lys metalloendopeptidase
MKFIKIARLVALISAVIVCYGSNIAQAAPATGISANNNALAVTLTPQKTVLKSSDDVIVNVKFSNQSGVDQFVLSWHTPFSDSPEGLFDVYRDGIKVAYMGPHYKRGAPVASDYLVLKAGKSYSQQVELSAMYDMSVRGNYTIRFRTASLHLYSGNVSQGVVAAEKQVGHLESSTVSMWLDGRQAVAGISASPSSSPVPLATLAGSLSFTRCSASQAADITTAISGAINYSSNSLGYVTAGTQGPRYTTWFGAYDAGRYNTVKAHYTAILDAFNNQPVVVDCGCKKTYYAYVYPNQPYKIYVCKAFWTAPMTGTDSKAGTLVHEMSHFNATSGTDDWAYGHTAAKSLAISDPAKAVDNADSHEYFSENTPAQN